MNKLVAVGIAIGLLWVFPVNAMAQDGPCVTLSREISEPIVTMGGQLEVQVTIESTCAETIRAIGLQEMLPAGWSFVELTENDSSLPLDERNADNPTIIRFDDDADRIDFGWFALTEATDDYPLVEFPLSFSYIVSVPPSKAIFDISGQVLYRLDGEELQSAVVTTQISDADIDGPVITLIGGDETLECGGDTYVEAGATAEDNLDGDVTASIVVGGDTVDTTTPGTYSITYDAQDSEMNDAIQVVRTVTVEDTTAPVLTLLGDAEATTFVGATSYEDAGATATDTCEGSVSVTVDTSAVNLTTAGDYTVTLSATDASGNQATPLTRTVHVVLDDEAPEITLLGDLEVEVDCADTYDEPGYTATDNGGAVNLTDEVEVTEAVSWSNEGTYTITYNVTDAAGNAATPAVRTIIVSGDSCDAPLCTLEGVSMIAPSGDRVVPALDDFWTTINGDVLLRSLVTVSDDVECDKGDIEVTYVLNEATETPLISENDETNYAVPVNLSLGTHMIDVYAARESTGAEVQGFLEFTFETSEDSNGDGYPDNLFGALDEAGDQWVATVGANMVGAQFDKSVYMVRLNGCAADDVPAIVVLPNPEDMNQTLTISVAQDVIECGDAGILIVTLADNLESLLGDDEAAVLGSAPEGLSAGGTFFDISIIVSDDNGDSFSELSESNLASGITLTLDGLNLDAEAPASFRAHATDVLSDGASGMLLQSGTGNWNEDGLSGVVIDGTTTLTATTTRLGIFAPFDPADKAATGCAAGTGRSDVSFGDFILMLVVMSVLVGISQLRARSQRD